MDEAHVSVLYYSHCFASLITTYLRLYLWNNWLVSLYWENCTLPCRGHCH